MAFQTTIRSWKHLAARLLLVPVVAGTSAGLAKAQSFQPSWRGGPAAAKPASPTPAMRPVPTAPAPASPTAPTVPPPAAAKAMEPKELVKAGRQALSEGRLDAARDFAVQADQAAAARQYKWGFFEDTPSELRKDCLEASAKADKAQAAELLKKAKTLYSQKAANDADRMASLDLALNMARQVENLHGPYSMWELGDKPATLINSIKNEQDALRKKMGMPAPATVATKSPATSVTSGPVMPSGPLVQAGATMPAPAPAANPAKTTVLKMVSDGRILLAQDKVLEAKAKADAARAMAAEKGLLNAFTANEDTPDSLITACKMKGAEMVKSLLVDADRQIAMNALDKASAACDMAMSMSTSLGLYPRPIDEKKQVIASKMKPAKSTTTASVAPPVIPQPAEYLVPAPPKNVLLEQAASELKRGDLEMARTIATRAWNDPRVTPADKAEAQAILRQIDVETANKRRNEAVTAMNNAMAAMAKNEHAQAYAVMAHIDPTLLAPEQKTRLDSAMKDCQAKMTPVKLASGVDPLKPGAATAPLAPLPVPQTTAPSPGVPSTLVTPVTKPAPIDPAKAEIDVAFDKLRSEAIDIMKKAGEAWGKGETDTCMKLLEEFTAKVSASNQPEPRKAMLIRPIKSRSDAYALLKHNYDFELKEAKEKIDNRNKILGTRVAEALKQDEIKKKVEEIEGLQAAGKHKEAELLALQVRSLDPENPSTKAIYELAKMKRRMADNDKFKEENEKFVFEGLNNAERQGPVVDTNDPLRVDPARALIAARRGEDGVLRAISKADQKVEGQLSASYPMLKFENMPLTAVIDQIRKSTHVNITVDYPSLEDEKLSIDSVIINEAFTDLSLHSALKVILEKARLVHIIEDGVVKITTEKRTKGRMKTKVFHVMDLVTPIPEYKLSDHHTLSGAMAAGSGRNLNPAIAGLNSDGSRRVMNGGELVSNGSVLPGNVSGGSLQSNATPNGVNPMTPTREQYAEKLKKMITMLVRQGSWADNASGGSGTIAYYDIGGAMVVNQTADVITEVDALLNSLRRLQDLSVAVEIRVVSLSETYFERIGVDFQANVTTNNVSFERSLATGSFRPEPFLNSMNGVNGVTTGWSPATGFTPDLGVPIRPSSYNLTAPPFGGYQNSLSPALNGGLSLGLAFLNDIQVYMFLEAAAGNRRINIMQAPKITLFNGQTSTVFVGDLAYFATGLQVYSANGQFVYLPINQAFPIGQGFNPNGTGTGTSNGVSVTVQAIISADRRFVRLNLTPSLTALASATVPLYPITTFITPVFEGGSQGQPIPFTQFFQQPSFTEVSAQTTVAIPDGGTVLLGGLKTLAQGRNEFGPPVLSHIPYLNRLFKNVGIGQETRHVMLMVTPRIIINSEEEARQTGSGIDGGLPPQP